MSIPMIHELKIEQNYLENLKKGTKKQEIRYNDRDYQKDEVLKFLDKEKSFGFDLKYSYFKITHIFSGFGLKEGYIILSVEQITEEEAKDV